MVRRLSMTLQLRGNYTARMIARVVAPRWKWTERSRRARNEQSVAVGARVQDEDLGICEAVQRGLKSRVYRAGRLSARREAGEHLFHRLLAADLKAGVQRATVAAG